MKTIYLRTNLINGKKYVGQTSDFKRRERDWRKLGASYSSKELNEDKIKYGLENWIVEILEEVDDIISDETERKYIEKYNTLYPNGYNKYSGGINGFTFEMQEEIKKRISETLKGRIISDETKKKMSVATRKRLSVQIDQIDPITGEVVASYPSAREAARQLGYSQANISMCCNGGFYRNGKWVNRLQYKGYVWKKRA